MRGYLHTIQSLVFKCSTAGSTTNAVIENNICYNVIPFPDHLPTNESTTDASHVFQNPQSQPQTVLQFDGQATATFVQSQPNLTDDTPSSLASNRHIGVAQSQSVPDCTDFEQWVPDGKRTDMPVQAVIGVNLHPNVAYFRSSNRTGADAELNENGTSGDYEYVYNQN